MGLDYTFHVEVRSENGWRVPPTLELRIRVSSLHGRRSLRRGRASINGSLLRPPGIFFLLRETIPPQWESSELYKYFVRFYDFQKNEWHISWIPYEALFVNDWHSEQLLVSEKVVVEYVQDFGDGASPFPKAALLSAGMRAWEVDDLRCGKLIDESINWNYGGNDVTSSPEHRPESSFQSLGETQYGTTLERMWQPHFSTSNASVRIQISASSLH